MIYVEKLREQIWNEKAQWLFPKNDEFPVFRVITLGGDRVNGRLNMWSMQRDIMPFGISSDSVLIMHELSVKHDWGFEKSHDAIARKLLKVWLNYPKNRYLVTCWKCSFHEHFEDVYLSYPLLHKLELLLGLPKRSLRIQIPQYVDPIQMVYRRKLVNNEIHYTYNNDLTDSHASTVNLFSGQKTRNNHINR